MKSKLNNRINKYSLAKLWLAICIILSNYTVLVSNTKDITKDLYTIAVSKAKIPNASNIFDIAIDSKGYLYITSNDGIYKYDGFEFDKINKKMNFYFGGSSIRFHNDNRLFYENFDGFVFSYDEKTNWEIYNKHKPIHYIPYGLFNNHFSFIYKDGLAIYDLKTNNQIRTIPYKSGYPQYATQNDKHYFLVNESKIAKFDDKKIIAEYNLNNKKTIINQLYTNGNRIYLVPRSEYNDGITVLDTNLNFITKFEIPKVNGIINKIQFLKNKIWILSTKGAYVHQFNNEKWIFEQKFFDNINSTNIIKGKNEEFWLSTIGQGLLLIPSLDQFIYRIENEKLTQIVASNNNYLFGTSNGKIIEVNNNFNNINVILQSKLSAPISYLYQNEKNKEIFYVSGVGFNYHTNTESLFLDIALKDVTYIDEDFYGLATSSDIILFKSKNHKNTSNWNTLYNKNKKHNNWASILNGKRSKSIFYYKNLNRLYFLTNIGLFYVDNNGIEGEIMINNKSVVAEKMQYLSNKIFLLNYNGLINYIDLNTNKLYTLNSDILDIGTTDSTLILKSKSGLQYYNPKSRKIEKITTDIQTTEINNFIIDKSSNVLLSTNNGIVQLPRKTNNKSIDKNSFIITKTLVNGDEWSISSLKSLTHNQNNIQIQFANLDFNQSSPPKVYYRINNSEWTETETGNRLLQFHELAPGNYSIEFKMENQIANEKVKFNIKPPFWQTWYFYLLITIIIITSLTIYNKIKRRNLNRNIKLLKEKIKLEKELGKSILTSIKAQMNPHFFFNALNSIQAFIYKNDSKQAISYLTKFSKLTRIILTQTDLEHIKLQDEINMLSLYLDIEIVRFNNSFTYKINTIDNLDTSSIYIPAMLIQPYVENCIKHGFVNLERIGKINIDFKVTNKNILHVIITDNGIGRYNSGLINQNRSEKSFATEANQKRLEILNQHRGISVRYTDLFNKEQISQGTQVELFIPIKTMNYVN